MRQENNGKYTAFDQAVLSIVDGNEAQLKSLLAAYPTLISQRSTAPHQATLLHYISANGVEDEFQRSPDNACDIATILLDAGAEVDALAECYGGGPAQTPLSLLVSSYHPAKAGVQAPLVTLLVKYGAKVDGIDDSSGPIATAIAFGYPSAAKALADNGAKISCVQFAAALGDLSKFNTFFDTNNELIADAGSHRSNVITSTNDKEAALSIAFWYACLHGQVDIARQLLNKGANINHKDKEGFTALHSASVRGKPELVSLLIDNQADIEVTNDYGGTVLDTLCWFATNVRSDDVDYISIATLLLNGGAKASAISPYPTGHKALDDLLRPYRNV